MQKCSLFLTVQNLKGELVINFYQKIRASKFVQTLLIPCNTVWFIAVPFLLALLSNMFSLEIPVYIIVIIVSGFIILFNDDTKPIIPFFVAMYFGTSRANSPIITDEGIYQTPWSLALVIGLAAVAVLCFAARIVLTGEHKKFRFKNMRMSVGLLIFGAALALSGAFSPEASLKNLLFGTLQFISFAFIYLYFTVTIDWKKCEIKYIAYVMAAMALLLCFELMWIYATVEDVIVDGIINKFVILTGWGIQNNIGGMMTLGLPFCYYLAVKERHGWVFVVLAELIFCVSLFTLSRTAILVGLGVVAVGSVLTLVLSQKKLALFIVFGTTAAVALTMYFIFLEELYVLYISIFANGMNLSGREALFVHGLSKYAEYPLFGGGWFMIQDTSLEVYDMFVPGRYHNMFVQIYASCGAVGMLAYVFHLQEVVRVTVRKFSPDRLFIAFGILTLIVLSQMDNHFFNIGPGLIYSAMLCFLEGDLIKSEIPVEQTAKKEVLLPAGAQIQG